MNITSARYTDASETSIAATIDGAELTVPVAPGNRHYEAIMSSGVAIAPYTAPVPTVEELCDRVDAERDRRAADGFVFDGRAYQSRPGDRENILGAHSSALAAILNGGGAAGDLYWHGGATPFEWIAADDSRVQMDAPTVLAFGGAALDHKSALIFKGSGIKARIRAGEDLDPTDPTLWE